MFGLEKRRAESVSGSQRLASEPTGTTLAASGPYAQELEVIADMRLLLRFAEEALTQGFSTPAAGNMRVVRALAGHAADSLEQRGGRA